MNGSATRYDSSLSFRVLTPEQVLQIHEATLAVLEKTGVEVQEEEAIELLRSAGAQVEGTRARLPRALVEEAINTAPKSVTLYRRDGSSGIALEKEKAYYGTGSDCPSIIDPETGEKRSWTKQDIAATARLVDALPNMDFLMSLGLMQDRPARVTDLHQFQAMILNTEKPIVFTAHDRRGMEAIVRMTSTIVGGDEKLRKAPCICLYAEPVSPLKHIGLAMRKMLLAAEREVPVVYTPCPMCGATAPSTLAGGLVVGNAEILSGLVIHQLKRPGAPFISGGVITILDMMTANISYGAPELHLLSAGYADIAHHYGIPMFGTAGCSDSKVLDEQAALEAAVSSLMMGLCGANLVHDVGFLEYALTGSMEMVVLTDEIVGMVRRIQQGIEVTPETLAVDVIDEAGPGGHFLYADHTLKHFRKEMWFPTLLDRNNRQRWEAEGSRTLGDKLNEKVLSILRSHKPTPVPNDVVEETNRQVKQYEQEVGK